MQVTIITGASRGIGKAIAEDLQPLDHFFIIYNNSKELNFINFKDVFDGITNMLLYGLNLRHSSSLKDIEQINIILCAAQIGDYKSINLDQILNLYKINVLGNLAIIQAAMNFSIPLRIVWFAGGGAAFPYPEFFGYSLSKVAVVRAVENIAVSGMLGKESSIIALAPGAVETDMLKTVLDAGCEVRTKTDISEPVNFVRKFITDEFDSLKLNGMFLHVRDDLSRIDEKKDIFKLRRIE